MTFEHSRKQQNVGYTDATIGCSWKQPKREQMLLCQKVPCSFSYNISHAKANYYITFFFSSSCRLFLSFSINSCRLLTKSYTKKIFQFTYGDQWDQLGILLDVCINFNRVLTAPPPALGGRLPSLDFFISFDFRTFLWAQYKFILINKTEYNQRVCILIRLYFKKVRLH